MREYLQVLADGLLSGSNGLTFGVCVGFIVIMVVFVKFAKRAQGRVFAGSGTRYDEGRVFGVVGLMGSGKTSFVVREFAIPALQIGRPVVSNFSIYDEKFNGTATLLKAQDFGFDLLGIGSSLNLDDEGLPMSGWFFDTACQCGKDHDASCPNPPGFVPVGERPCCAGFRARRDCGCRGALVIIDEGHAFVPAAGSRPLPLDLHTWFTMARKNHLQIIWLTQYYKWIHSAVRRLSEDVFFCRPLIGDGQHVADLHKLDPIKGDVGALPVASVKYDNRPIREFYDTREVILPAATAHEIAGNLDRKRGLRDRERGGSARHEQTARHSVADSVIFG